MVLVFCHRRLNPIVRNICRGAVEHEVKNGRTSNAFFEATKCSLPSTVEPTKATAIGMHMTEPEHQVIDSLKRIQIRSEASLTPARKLSGVFRRGRPEASGPPRERPACRVRCARHGPGLRSVSKQAAGRRHRQGHGSLSSGRPTSDPCNRIDRLFLALAACRRRRIEDHSIIWIVSLGEPVGLPVDAAPSGRVFCTWCASLVLRYQPSFFRPWGKRCSFRPFPPVHHHCF
jgi:hypothetical protein